MELRHLRYFVAVAGELNFSRAAQQLHMAQPPLSRQIRQLEDELGAELFDRRARPLRLTPAGQFFYSQTTQMLDRLAEVRAATRRIAHKDRAWFGIGFVPSTLYGLLPEVIRRFRQAHPTVEVGLSELTSLQQIDALKAGRIDVGFGRLRFDDPAITSKLVQQEALVAALPTGHRLTGQSRLELSDLANEPLLLYPAKPRPSYADELLEMFRSRGLRPAVALEANEMQTALGLVASGVGYALVPQSVESLRREGVAYLPLADLEVVSPVIMNWRSGDASGLVSAFHAFVEEAIASMTY